MIVPGRRHPIGLLLVLATAIVCLAAPAASTCGDRQLDQGLQRRTSEPGRLSLERRRRASLRIDQHLRHQRNHGPEASRHRPPGEPQERAPGPAAGKHRQRGRLSQVPAGQVPGQCGKDTIIGTVDRLGSVHRKGDDHGTGLQPRPATRHAPAVRLRGRRHARPHQLQDQERDRLRGDGGTRQPHPGGAALLVDGEDLGRPGRSQPRCLQGRGLPGPAGRAVALQPDTVRSHAGDRTRAQLLAARGHVRLPAPPRKRRR